VAKVDAAKDALPKNFRPANGIERGAYKYYDAQKMAGLPIAIQVVGRRLTEEKVLAYMKIATDALAESGNVYEHLDVDNLPEVEELAHRKEKIPVDPKRIW